jgi:DNA-directed RNA polymerase specialized sigma24 family protein
MPGPSPIRLSASPSPIYRIEDEAFEKLLTWLDADRDCAGERYERLRKKLIAFFEHRHIPAEEYTDKTFDRVADLLEKGKAIPPEKQDQYCLGVARNLAKEFWHSRENQSKKHESSAMANDDPVAEQLCEERQQAWIDRRNECAKHCLEQLKPDQRRLLLLYCDGDEKTRAHNRRKLAEELGISDEALRVRVHRTRHILRKCYQDCLRRHGV